jgi:hypothetical protein
MSVEVYIWYGDLRDSTVLNGLLRQNVGHASMMIIEDTNPSKRIYISHRPKSPHEYQVLTRKDNSKKYYKEDFCDKASPISLEDECENKGREYDEKIELFGLDEIKIKKSYEDYLNGGLPENRNQYHILENNCCSMIVYFLRKGLKCSNNLCSKCDPSNCLPDKEEIKPREHRKVLLSICEAFIVLLFLNSFSSTLPSHSASLIVAIYVIRAGVEPWIRLSFNLEHWVISDSSKFWSPSIRSKLNMEPYGGNHSSNFWSPKTLKYFTRRLKKREDVQCLVFNANPNISNTQTTKLEIKHEAIIK